MNKIIRLLIISVLVVLIFFIIKGESRFLKKTNNDYDKKIQNEISEFKPYAEKQISKLSLQHLELLNVEIKNENVIAYYENKDNKVNAINLKIKSSKYFSFDKVQIILDNKITKPYMEYRYLDKKIPEEVTFENGVDPRLTVLPGYYDVKIYMPKS